MLINNTKSKEKTEDEPAQRNCFARKKGAISQFTKKHELELQHFETMQSPHRKIKHIHSALSDFPKIKNY